MKTRPGLSLLAVFATLCGFPAGAESTRPPNVVIILSDDQGYGDVGFNGGEEIPTPAMDSIAENGVAFTNGYVTAPQCAPSRAGLLAGRYQNAFGREHNHSLDAFGVPDDVRLFPEYMKRAGFATGMVGKWHLSASPLSANPSDTPNARGFDSFYGHLTGGTHYFPPEGKDTIPYLRRNGAPARASRYLTHVFGDEATRFIRRHENEPFFLYLAFNAPHAPLQAPEKYLERFEHLASPDDKPVECGYTGRTIDHPRQVYAAMVAAMDDAIQRVLETLRERGIEEDTLLFFLSDNGGPTPLTRASNEPLRGYKGDVLEGGIRVPFAMQWPGTIPAGQVIDTPVIALDLLPTALGAIGASDRASKELDGRNLLPLVTHGGQAWPSEPRTLFWRFPHPPPREESHVRAVRRGPWKIAQEALHGRARQQRGPTRDGLYHLPSDIDESNDAREQRPAIHRRLERAYQKWSDTLPPKMQWSRSQARKNARAMPRERWERHAPWSAADPNRP